MNRRLLVIMATIAIFHVAPACNHPKTQPTKSRPTTLGNILIGEGASDYLVSGFGGLEPNSEAPDAFRWSVGTQSEILVTLEKQTAYTLDLTILGIPNPHKTDQIMEVYLNRSLLSKIVVTPNQYKDYSLTLPKDRVLEDNSIVFKYTYAISPKSEGGSTDDRQLAVRFRKISFTKAQ
jgi:hypothetical protein